jgi:hypothetical protein
MVLINYYIGNGHPNADPQPSTKDPHPPSNDGQSVVNGGQFSVIHSHVSGQAIVRIGQFQRVLIGIGHPVLVTMVPPLVCCASKLETTFLFSESFFKLFLFFFMVF